MKRRNFIKSSTIGTAAVIVPVGISENLDRNVFTDSRPQYGYSEKYNQKAGDIKLNILPVFSARIHDGAYGGPCRWQPYEETTPEYETQQFKQSSEKFFKTVNDNLSAIANIMEPVPIVLWRITKEYQKGDIILPEIWEEIDRQIPEVDLFLTNYRTPGLERYNKPTAVVGSGSPNLDWISALRNKGVEAHDPFNWEQMIELVKLLRVRKAVQSTRILQVTDRPEFTAVCELADDPIKALKENYGVDYYNCSYQEFFNEMDNICSDPEKQKEAREIHDKLVSNAENIFMNRDYVLNDVNLYLTAKSVMQKNNCNAFALRCFELCGSHIGATRKITPCLTNILLRDEGYPSCCEGDINALFTAMVLMYLDRITPYMGNVEYRPEGNIISMNHDSAGFRLKGWDKPEIPYEIRNFVHESNGGFGTTIRYDFARDTGQEVTVCRSNYVRKKMLIAKGKITGGKGFNESGCTLGFEFEVPDVEGLYHACADIGNHLIIVYGDFTGEIKKLARIMNFEIVEA